MKQHPRRKLATLTLALSVVAAQAAADCPGEQVVAKLAAAYEAREPAQNPPAMTAEQARCASARMNALLQEKMGRPVGYKAGLTNPALQQRFNHDSPVRGTLYAPMLLPGGTSVEATFGARPMFEADLLLRVSNSAINRAQTAQEVLESIDQVIPFIELPDLLVADPSGLDGPAIIAINVGARLGVMGTPIAVERESAFADALRDMQVIVRGDGIELDRGRGSDVLEQPLDAVIWLVQDLARDGLALAPGDLVSVGSFSRLLPPRPGLAVEVQYQGLPGNPRVSVNFK